MTLQFGAPNLGPLALLILSYTFLRYLDKIGHVVPPIFVKTISILDVMARNYLNQAQFHKPLTTVL